MSETAKWVSHIRFRQPSRVGCSPRKAGTPALDLVRVPIRSSRVEQGISIVSLFVSVGHEPRFHLLVQVCDERPGSVPDTLFQISSFPALLKQLVSDVERSQNGQALRSYKLGALLDLQDPIIKIANKHSDVRLIGVTSDNVTLLAYMNDDGSFSHKPLCTCTWLNSKVAFNSLSSSLESRSPTRNETNCCETAQEGSWPGQPVAHGRGCRSRIPWWGSHWRCQSS